MAKFQNILETVGNTPVVRINRLAPPDVNLFAKIEAFKSGPKSRHIAEKVAAAMIFNMVVLSEYEDESMMGAVTNPLSTWKRDLPKV